jgi:hypothetical protein
MLAAQQVMQARVGSNVLWCIKFTLCRVWKEWAAFDGLYTGTSALTIG